jgi:hypothetical protein
MPYTQIARVTNGVTEYWRLRRIEHTRCILESISERAFDRGQAWAYACDVPLDLDDDGEMRDPEALVSARVEAAVDEYLRAKPPAPGAVTATRIFKTGDGDTGTALVAGYTQRDTHNRDVAFFVATFTPSPMIADGYVSASGALRSLVSTLHDHATDLASIADQLEREGR